MSISVDCPQCGDSLSVNERLAGREVRCPSCEELIPVPRIPDPEIQQAEPVVAEPVMAEPVSAESTAPMTEASPSDRWLDPDAVVADGDTPSETQDEDLPTAVAIPVTASGLKLDFSSLQQGIPVASEPAGFDAEEEDDEDEDLTALLSRRGGDDDEELDMTPMVDVTFLLLIFFMVTASFSLQKSIQMPRQTTDLPSATNTPDPIDDLDTVELEIDEFGSFLVLSPDWERESPGKQNLINTLRDAMAERSGGMKLSVKVHEMAKLQSLVDGMDAGTIAGFSEIKVTQVDGFD